MAGPLQVSWGMLKSLARWAWSQGGTRWEGTAGWDVTPILISVPGMVARSSFWAVSLACRNVVWDKLPNSVRAGTVCVLCATAPASLVHHRHPVTSCRLLSE